MSDYPANLLTYTLVASNQSLRLMTVTDEGFSPPIFMSKSEVIAYRDALDKVISKMAEED